MNANDVDTWLRDGGWPSERIGDNTWKSHFRGRRGSFPVFIRLQGEYVTFAIVPFLRSPPDEPNANALYQRLLVLNQSMMLAKFSIDDDLDVVLSVEYPTADLDPSEFDDALDVLSFYADSHHGELKEIADRA